jgi:hypothetical protein
MDSVAGAAVRLRDVVARGRRGGFGAAAVASSFVAAVERLAEVERDRPALELVRVVPDGAADRGRLVVRWAGGSGGAGVATGGGEAACRASIARS